MFPDQSAPNLLQGLNPEQLSAVTWRRNPPSFWQAQAAAKRAC